MDGKTILILGGGWGGLSVAHDLRGLLPPEHRILVVERNERFSLCMSYLWLMTGERDHPSEVRREMAKLARPGIEWIHDDVRGIDPETRTVHTGSGTITGDYLVVALGAELAPDAVPGLAEGGHNLYEADGATQLRKALTEFPGGQVLVLIARTPIRCPAAPYEAAFLTDWILRKKGIRNRVDLAVYTPEPQPMPVAGPAVGEALRTMLADRNIDYHPGQAVSRVDAPSRTAVFDPEEASYDLLITVPPHWAPQAVAEAGLTDATGYVPVHPQTLEILADVETLETRHPGVFAIGDVTAVRLLNSMFLPKAGVFVEAEARVVAENIAAELRGEEPRAHFDGKGFCYVEVGDGMAAYGVGDFYAYPGPRVRLEPPSREHKRAKEQFERVLDSWFVP